MSEISTKVITPEARLSYPHLHQPQANQEGGKPKYSVALVFGKGTSREQLDAAIVEAARQKFGETMTVSGRKITIAAAIKLGVLRSPIRTDVEAKNYQDAAFFINARSDNQPGLVYAWAGEDNKPAKVPQDKIKDDFYPGAFVRASLTFFGYDKAGNKGVGASLNNIQKLRDGERLDSRVKAEDEFDADLSAAPADLEALAG